MDSTKFDRLARALASAPSRRSVLAGLAGAALGAGALAAEPAAAACRKVGDDCNRNGQCCDDARCRNGRCRCKSGFRACDGRCKDLDTDNDNCGRCGRKCGNNETCVKEQGEEARCRPADGRCAEIGQRCDDGVGCCGGLRCAAGNAAFKACVLA